MNIQIYVYSFRPAQSIRIDGMIVSLKFPSTVIGVWITHMIYGTRSKPKKGIG